MEVVKRGTGKKDKISTTALKTVQTIKPTLRTRTPAIMVDIGRDEFPELAKKIRDGVSKEVIGSSVVGMRHAKAGGLLIEVRGDQVQVEAVMAEVTKHAGTDVGV